MTSTYRRYSTRETPQSEPIPGSVQVANSAGGFSFAVDDWKRAERFLVLGSEGGTFYIGEQKLTSENAEGLLRCIAADGVKLVSLIRMISEQGRAYKNDPAIFALALASAHGDERTKRAAYQALPQVCRTGTHLLHFAAFRKQFAGSGHGFRRALSRWLLDRDANSLAYQVSKYQSRDSWAMHDILNVAHPVTTDAAKNIIFNWIVNGDNWTMDEATFGNGQFREALAPIIGLELAKQATSEDEIVSLIEQYNLVREAIPTQWLKSPAVWEALLQRMPLGATIRNLATMTRNGLLTPMSDATDLVVSRISDQDNLKAARIHPLGVLGAMMAYTNSSSFSRSRGDSFTPVSKIVNALDAAFYASFGNIVPANKRTLIGVDVSGSMSGGLIAGLPGVTPNVASTAMALVLSATEPKVQICAFDDDFKEVELSSRERLDSAAKKLSHWNFGGTDCSLPMTWALEQKAEFDTFMVLTDSETWAGHIHPAQALHKYREKMGIPAKLVVVGMTSNGFSIADPRDAGMLDVVGFDAGAPSIINDFAR